MLSVNGCTVNWNPNPNPATGLVSQNLDLTITLSGEDRSRRNPCSVRSTSYRNSNRLFSPGEAPRRTNGYYASPRASNVKVLEM